MTNRQKAIRERGLAKAREMAKTHKITREDREMTETMVLIAITAIIIGTIQSIIILL